MQDSIAAARSQIKIVLDSIVQSESATSNKADLIWKCYAHAEMAVLLLKLALGEDILLSQVPPSEKSSRDVSELVREADSMLSRGETEEALRLLRTARDSLMDNLKINRKRRRG